MNYQQRLKDFNKSRKYLLEVKFLQGLLPIGRLLDYGCGTGFTTNIIRLNGSRVDGYDLNKWNESFKYIEPDGEYNGIYFMHSLAHLESPLETIIGLKQHLKKDGKLIIITPNKDWIENIPPSPDYKPDPTVKQHFCQYKLETLLTDAGYKIDIQGQFGERKGDFNERIFITAGL